MKKLKRQLDNQLYHFVSTSVAKLKRQLDLTTDVDAMWYSWLCTRY